MPRRGSLGQRGPKAVRMTPFKQPMPDSSSMRYAPRASTWKSSSWSSDENESVQSGSSVCTEEDELRPFTLKEESRIRRSLRRKLLSDDGERLGRIERRLLRADRQRKGTVSVSTFKAALAADSRSNHGADIRREEVQWLTQSLASRNGKNIAILKIKELLQEKKEGGGARSYHHHRDRRDATRRGDSMSQHNGRGRRRDGLNAVEGRGHLVGTGGSTTSESDSSDRETVGSQRHWRPSHPARWAIQQGTVGQWLHDVAAPLERKLFCEFMEGLTAFEVRNGLDHFRVRPSAKRSGGFDNPRRFGEEDGATILHLGPMLKASIRFYV